MFLNHHKDLTLNYSFQYLFKKTKTTNQKTNTRKENQTPQQISSSSALSELSSTSRTESSPFYCPCRDAEFIHTAATTTEHLYCDILELLCMLRNQMLPLPLGIPSLIHQCSCHRQCLKLICSIPSQCDTAVAPHPFTVSPIFLHSTDGTNTILLPYYFFSMPKLTGIFLLSIAGCWSDLTLNFKIQHSFSASSAYSSSPCTLTLHYPSICHPPATFKMHVMSVSSFKDKHLAAHFSTLVSGINAVIHIKCIKVFWFCFPPCMFK